MAVQEPFLVPFSTMKCGMANAGYFVFYTNPRGSDGFGSEYGDICGKYGTVDYEDLMAFTDHVLAKETDIDPSRVGVTGGSYGGFMTNWIIGHTDRFAAAVPSVLLQTGSPLNTCQISGIPLPDGSSQFLP